jgi:hypothetical protein
MVEQALYHQGVCDTVLAPSLVMKMQTGSTNNQIFFGFAAPMYCWDWLAAPLY